MTSLVIYIALPLKRGSFDRGYYTYCSGVVLLLYDAVVVIGVPYYCWFMPIIIEGWTTPAVVPEVRDSTFDTNN